MTVQNLKAIKGEKGEKGEPGASVGVAEADLKIIRGEVSAAGAVISGEGFTAERISEGKYKINFTAAFKSAPAVLLAVQNSVNFRHAMLEGIPAAGSALIRIVTAANAVGDSNFDFLAIGPHV